MRIAFGIMGGWNQSQAHAQFISDVVDHQMNIQAALEAPRFTKQTFGGRDVELESRVPAEMRVGPVQRDSPLAGCGMIVVNPPFVLENELAAILRELTPLLACGPGAAYRVHWLAGE